MPYGLLMYTVAETEIFQRYAASIWSEGERIELSSELPQIRWLLIAYAKAKFDNLPAEFLAKLKTEVERG